MAAASCRARICTGSCGWILPNSSTVDIGDGGRFPPFPAVLEHNDKRSPSMVEEFIQSYTDNPRLVAISAIAFLIGYLQYIYAFRLVNREGSAPYPVWMHTFYFAHDFTGAVVFYLLAREHGFFWFFSGASIALIIWNCFEVYSLYMAVKVERQEIWGRFYSAPVTVSQAVYRIVGQIALMFCVVNLFRVFMNDVVMFKWFAFTNVLMVVAPGFLWNERMSRRGTAVGLAIVNLVCAIYTFLPPGYGMWTTASTYFDQPWFYITGVVVTLYGAHNLLMLLRFPAKPVVDGRAPIW
jgi:hypothetical protein